MHSRIVKVSMLARGIGSVSRLSSGSIDKARCAGWVQLKKSVDVAPFTCITSV